MNDVEYKNVKGHVEVYENGEFIFSEDNQTQARREYNRGFCEHSGKYCGNDGCEGCYYISPCMVSREY